MVQLAEEFSREFHVECGNDEKLSSLNMQLRYQVWCVENNYFSPSLYEDKKEFDQYDDRSVYVVLSNASRKINIATARVILHDKFNLEEKFPVEHFVMLRRNERDLYWGVPRQQIGEVSRFCVSKVYRRRAIEMATMHGISSVEYKSYSTGRRSHSHITLGLFKGIIEVSLENNLKFWYALMEPSLLKVLQVYGIRFTSVGPLVSYYGMRQPCMVAIDSILAGIRHNSSLIGDFVCPLLRPSYPGSDSLHVDTLQ